MENILASRIHIITILCVLIFLFFIFRLVTKGKLREEYSIIWIISSVLFLVFAFWREGLDVFAKIMGVYYAPTLLFMIATFAIVLFLVHLSVVNSRQHEEIKKLAQEIALLKKKIENTNL
jgi:hypothetical protein